MTPPPPTAKQVSNLQEARNMRARILVGLRAAEKQGSPTWYKKGALKDALRFADIMCRSEEHADCFMPVHGTYVRFEARHALGVAELAA